MFTLSKVKLYILLYLSQSIGTQSLDRVLRIFQMGLFLFNSPYPLMHEDTTIFSHEILLL